jgi:hypothetical protein
MSNTHEDEVPPEVPAEDPAAGPTEATPGSPDAGSDAPRPAQYLIARDGRRFGPYSVEEVEHHIRHGRIVGTDLCWTEGMPGWALVSNVFEQDGTLTPVSPEVPEAAAPAPSPALLSVPPPSLHWVLVLVLSVATLGFFSILWSCAQAAWVRRIDSRSRGLVLLIVAIAIAFAAGFIDASVNGGKRETTSAILLVGQLISTALTILAYFDMRRSMVRYFNSIEPIGLSMSGVMTFFFTMLYTQYHMSRIARWKRTGQLSR